MSDEEAREETERDAEEDLELSDEDAEKVAGALEGWDVKKNPKL